MLLLDKSASQQSEGGNSKQADGVHQYDEDGGGGNGGNDFAVAVAVVVSVINGDSRAAVQTGVWVLRCLTLCG